MASALSPLQKRATKKCTPVKSPENNANNGNPRATRASDTPYYASHLNYNEQDEEHEVENNPYGYAGKAKAKSHKVNCV
jgi:hypothetical protein